LLGTIVLLAAVFWLAYSNGANDNYKGVATLYGSGAASYRTALNWSTIATFAGSLLSIALAESLARKFSGEGLIPAEAAQGEGLLISVALAAAATVFLATLLGMPTSTTHALTGALAGAAIVISGGSANFAVLWASFFKPLLISPVIAIVAAAILYRVLRYWRLRLGVNRQTCICVGDSAPKPVVLSHSGAVLLAAPTDGGPAIQIGSTDECVQRYDGAVMGISAQVVVEKIHWLSAMAVCFGRAVNDTPKIAALLLVAGATGVDWKLGLVAIAMAAGGLINARRVAITMGQRITNLNPGQGLTGNLVTAALVLGASRMGVPVSTTHVSCGSIFGIGVAGEGAKWRTVSLILLTWVTTLPLAATLGGSLYWVIAGTGE
jgi:PiT family inorganic phosphate transporter